jgi:GT2 family glycosyltransferase
VTSLDSDPGDAPAVSVIVPTFRRPASVVRLLAALGEQSSTPANFEAVVSIDGHGDGTREAIEALTPAFALQIAEGPHRGRAAACNAGLELARGGVIITLDDDMEPVPDWLSRHLEHHTGTANVCVMGAVPVRLDANSTSAARYIAWKFDLHLRKLAQPDHSFALRDFFSGNTSMRADVLRTVGAFDDSYTAYGNEDLELSLRLQAAGVKLVYDAAAMAYQHYEKALPQLASDMRDKGTTAVLLARSHPAAFEELQLAKLDVHSRRWRALRALLLQATRAFPSVSRVILLLGRLVEHTRIRSRPAFYSLLLDYFYWAGADEALAAETTPDRLRQLAADLRRGPLGLLLRR